MHTKKMTQGALIAALYVVLTLLSNLFGLANGAIQVRLSEMLTVLPAFSLSAIPGLTIGCLLANLLTGCALWDVVFGTLATLIGAIFTRAIGKKHAVLAAVPPVAANTVIVPLVLQNVYGATEALPYLCTTICLSECISCGILGCLLYSVFKKRNPFL